MKKSEALLNALALFHYADWQYADEIVTLTSYTLCYDVTIQLHYDRYDTEEEDKRLRQIIACGAKIYTTNANDGKSLIYTATYYIDD